MEILVAVNNLSHSFGKKKVLSDISLCFGRGEVIGLLGPSGAGKTTLVNLLTMQLKPEGGTIKVSKENLSIGIMMDSFGLYDRLTVWDNLKLFADIYHVPHGRINGLLERAELIGAKKSVVGNLSKGMRSRVNFCRALLKETDILYLDEPTSGLDPATTEKIHELVKEEREKGTAIFLTTHNMHEAEVLCTSILLLHEGRVVERGAPKELCRKYNTEHTIEMVLEGGERHMLKNDEESADIFLASWKEGKIASIHSQEPDLEQVFLRLTGRRLNGA